MGRCSTRPSPSAATCRCRPISPRGARPTSRTAPTTRPLFARDEGSVAAPTAGLHFTDELLARLAARGVALHKVTLHVGAGTFLPVKADDTAGHKMHAEFGTRDGRDGGRAQRRARQRRAHRRGRLDRAAAAGKRGRRRRHARGLLPARPRSSSRPATASSAVDLMLTNFHLPRSTLFMLVVGVLRPRHDEARLCARDRGRLSLLFLRRRLPAVSGRPMSDAFSFTPDRRPTARRAAARSSRRTARCRRRPSCRSARRRR